MTQDGPRGTPSDQSKSGNLKTRLVSAVVLAPLVLAAVYLGGLLFLCLVLAACVLIAWEWSNLAFSAQAVRQAALLSLAGVVLCITTYVGRFDLLTVLALVFAAVVLVNAPAGHRHWAIMGLLYAAVPMIALIILRGDPKFGREGVFFILLIVWACDTGAYFCGRAIGGAKLAPRISPGKTWAGFFGGVVAGGLVATALAGFATNGSLFAAGVVGLFLAAVSQGGDLLESAVKRRFGAKDSGILIPGHGGIMDRLDGVVAAAVLGCVIGVARLGVEEASTGLLLW